MFVAGRQHTFLTLLAFVCASISGAALLLHAAGWLPIYFMVDVVGPPSLVLLLALGVIATRINQPVFVNRLTVGTWGGLVATVLYDLVRLGLWQSGIIRFDPFIAHPIFGRLITGLPETNPLSIGIGWAYHFWNGFGFGIMYTLVAGPARWWYAVVWALFLEICWLLALPSTLQFQLNPSLVTLSVIGHTAYGITLGLIARKYIRA